MPNLLTRCWENVNQEERYRLLRIAPSIQDNDSVLTLETTSQRIAVSDWALWAYFTLFGREGFFSAAPLFPAPRVVQIFNNKAETDENTQSKLEIFYPWIRDAIQKTISFFVAQSASSTVLYFIAESAFAPPGQVFDKRYILMQKANEELSAGFQINNVAMKAISFKEMTPIFWFVAIPLVLRLLMELVRINPKVKEKTVDEYHLANSWKEFAKLCGFQVVEVILANVVVNLIECMLGTPKEAVINDPVMINGLKIILAVGLDLMRNTVEKLMTLMKENDLCCIPGMRSGYSQLA